MPKSTPSQGAAVACAACPGPACSWLSFRVWAWALAVESAIAELVDVSRGLHPVLIAGAPLRNAGGLFNTAVVIRQGSVLGVVPKTYLPNYREFYEKRHFTSGAGIYGRQIKVASGHAPFGTDLLFRSTGSVDVTFHVELCEDFWAPLRRCRLRPRRRWQVPKC